MTEDTNLNWYTPYLTYPLHDFDDAVWSFICVPYSLRDLEVSYAIISSKLGVTSLHMKELNFLRYNSSILPLYVYTAGRQAGNRRIVTKV